MHFSFEPLAPPAPAHPGGGGADSGSCFVPPGGLPTEPTLRAHVMRMRSLRPGLHMHSDDTREPRDMVARTEIDEGVRIVLLLDGLVDVTYGQRRMSLRGSTAQPAALMVSVTEPDQFIRRTRRGGYARRVSLGLGMEWIAQTLGGDGARGASPAVADFLRQHLSMHQWQMSPRAVAIAEQIVRPPQFEPILQNIYLESRALELAAEAIGALSRHSSAPPPPAASSLRPQEHRRMRDLHAFLSTGEADDLSLDDIARHAGLNANSLQKQFRALYGTTVFDFIRQTRLQRARQALERDGLTVGQAALMAGYTSAANFATAYRRCFGISPKQSRARV